MWNFYSGIENEHEIYSCAQLEAQEELSKAVETSSLGGGSISKTPEANDTTKIIKKDNIILGISDLKQQQQRKLSAESKVTSGANKSVNNNKKENKVVVGQSVVTINPINTIKVNNCEIINQRPRSVTAAIFAQPTILSSKIAESVEASIKASIKAIIKTHHVEECSDNQETSPSKIFRPSNPNATSVTSTIFAPRTKDMNKGYLMFSEEDTGLASKLHTSFYLFNRSY